MSRETRKDEHVNLALRTDAIPDASDFDALQIIHRSLPETSVSSVNLSTNLGSLTLPVPLYINAMTGGSKRTADINRQLAEAARRTGVAMAVGSQHGACRDERLVHTYKVVRDINPDGIVFANIGAGAPIGFAERAVDMIEANALQIHLNAPQELVMPEGDRDFCGWLRNVEAMVQHVQVPVIVKEVGFGMSADTYHTLIGIGVQAVDVGGRGGTNFAWIENQRRTRHDYEFLQGWGQSTPVSLLEAQPFVHQLIVLASGGVRHPLDVVKCLCLGARATGIAGPILRLIYDAGVDAVAARITDWIDQLRSLFVLLGARSVSDLSDVAMVVGAPLRDWCEDRGIDVRRIANRRTST